MTPLTGKLATPVEWALSHPGLAYAGLFLLSIVANQRTLMPLPFETSQVDYPKFIYGGHLIMNGLSEGSFRLPDLSEYPAATLLNSLLYVPFHKSPDWLILTGWAGRFVLWSGMWVSVYLLATRLPGRGIAVLAGLLFLMLPIAEKLLVEAPYSLLPVLACTSLWAFIGYLQTRRLRWVIVASSGLGLTALTRTDGMVLCAMFPLLVALVTWHRRHSLGRQRSVVLAAATLLPMLTIIAGYVAVARATQPQQDAGAARLAFSAYLYFEMGRIETIEDVRALPAHVTHVRETFGTRADNQGSVVQAALRHPAAMAVRVGENVLSLGAVALLAYGGAQGAVMLAMAAAGLVALAVRRRADLALTFAVWSGFLAVYLPFHYDASFVSLPFFVVVCLAAYGGFALWTELAARGPAGERGAGALALLGAAAILGSVAARPVDVRFGPPTMGITPEEQASAYLFAHLSRKYPVAALEQSVPAMAKNLPVPLTRLLLESRSLTPERVRSFLQRNGSEFAFLSPTLQTIMPELHQQLLDGLESQEVASWHETNPVRLAACQQYGVPCTYRLIRLNIS